MDRLMVAALGAVALVMGCASQQVVGPGGGPGIPPVAIGEGRPSPAPLRATLRLPDGAVNVPVVILLHGCGGPNANTGVWAERLAGWGYGSLALDSFTSRQVSTVCAPDRQRLVTRFDRAADVVAAVRWLRTQPNVDATRLAVLGASHGGSSAATITLHPFADEVAGSVRGVVDYYGACREVPRYSGMPLLALAGTDDTWGDPARRCEAFKAEAPPGSDIEVAAYPGVLHAFDNPRLVQRRYSETHPLQYDRAAAEDSFGRVRAFLARVLGEGGQRR